jgi:hypothetical protein
MGNRHPQANSPCCGDVGPDRSAGKIIVSAVAALGKIVAVLCLKTHMDCVTHWREVTFEVDLPVS